MSECKLCGRPTEDGQALCQACQEAFGEQATRVFDAWKAPVNESDGGANANFTKDVGEQSGDAAAPTTHFASGRDDGTGASAPAVPPKSGGVNLLALLPGVALVLFLLFFAAALLWGSSSGSEESGGVTALDSWAGALDSEGDAGAETLTITAADAQQVTDNVAPADPLAGHTYEVVVTDVSWSEANQFAQAVGGHLATITSQEEYDAICALADQAATGEDASLRYLWLGATVGANGWQGSDCWVTGESWSFDCWYPGEPSGQDEDGTVESVLCMWRVGDDGWTFNDQRNDLLEVIPTASGKIGYVIEWDP
jgi:hypothetical protein